VILDALDRLMVGRTTFIIAHRLSTVRYSDMILVLNDGKLVEHGTHSELIAAKGMYYQLHEVQTTQRKSKRIEAESAQLASAEPA
jgi:ABC-type multidrug transport system fused ATPase/permease subunit